MVEYRFTLTYNSTSTVLATNEQPKNFSSVRSVIARDFKTHGTFYQFTDGNLKLEFPGTGRTIINNAFESEGVGAIVTLLVERRPDEYSAYSTIFTGEANFLSYEFNQDYAVVDFENIDIQTKINSRKDIDYDTSRTMNLEGGEISPDYTSMNFNSLIIYFQSSLNLFPAGNAIPLIVINEGAPVTFTQTSGSETGFETVLDEIKYIDGDRAAMDSSFSNGFSRDIETFDDGTTSLNGFNTNAGFEFKADRGAQEYEVEIEYDFVDATVQGGASGVTGLMILTYEVRGDNEILIEVDQRTTLTGSPTDYNFSKTISISKVTKRVYLGLFTSTGAGASSNTLFVDDVTITASWLSEYDDNVVLGQLMHEAIDKNLEFITGEENFLYSDILGRTDIGYPTDGTAGLFFETNGYAIRSNSRGIIGNLKNRLDSLNAILNIGHGVQFKDYDKTEYQYRVEPSEYFYQPVELASFTEIEQQSYNEVFYPELGFSQIDSGYKTFPSDDEEAGSDLDWFGNSVYNFQNQSLIPTDDNGNTKKYSITSGYIVSPYLMERTRRVQFSTDPTTTTKYDNDLFLIQLENDYPNYKQLGSTSIFTTSTGEFENQPLEVFNSYFNFLLRPIYSVINHGFIINSALFRKLASTEIINTSYTNNQTVTYQIAASTDLGNKVLYQNNASPLKSELESGDALFDPILINFKCAMTRDQADELILGHQNGLNDKNYGYISVTDPDGNIKEGWVLELKFSPVDEIGEFVLIKRASYPG